MSEQMEKKSAGLSNIHFLAAVNSLLENITDKDETIRNAIENSLYRMCEKRPNITIDTLCDFRVKHPKLNEQHISLILRIIENFTMTLTNQLNADVLQKIIDLTTNEIIKTVHEHSPQVQQPCLEILVSIGRVHCDKVMDSLTKQLQKGNATHFMILHCLGTLATANISGIMPYMKSTLETILPTLSQIKLDHSKQAYAIAIGRFAEAITEHSLNISSSASKSPFETTSSKNPFETTSSKNPFESSNDSVSNSSENVNADNGEVVVNNDNETIDEQDNVNQPTDDGSPEIYQRNIDVSYATEISIAYEVFFNQWLPNREPKVASEILQALSFMYPLLPDEKSIDQIGKTIPQLLNFYRRSMDRNAVTQLLSAILKTTINRNYKCLNTLSDTLIGTLFDLVCVTPDYEKPHTVKGHYEVLRCFDLLFEIYSLKILDMLLIQLCNNNERERIKSLLVLTHLTNTADKFVEQKLMEFIDVLKQMIIYEKIVKIKMVLLKTIVVFSQKNFIGDKEFIRFILRNCLRTSKQHQQQQLQQSNNLSDHTVVIDEYNDFVEACINTMYVLSSTIESMNELLKCELLHSFMLIDHTSICDVIAKCLAKLYEKSSQRQKLIFENDLLAMGLNNDHQQLSDSALIKQSTMTEEENNHKQTVQQNASVPSPESIFIRSIVLMGNLKETKRTINILNFLKQYSIVFNNQRITLLWNEKIPEIQSLTIKDGFINEIYQLFTLTVKEMNDIKFSDSIVNKIADQIILYPNSITSSQSTIAISPSTPLSASTMSVQQQQHHQQLPPILTDIYIPDLQIERGMLLKTLGIALCHIQDQPTIEIKIDLIIFTARNEKLDSKNTQLSEYETRLRDAAESLGFLSKSHWSLLMKKLSVLIEYLNNRKHSGTIFQALNFMKDSNKEADYYKINLLCIETFEYIIQNIQPEIILTHHIDEQIIQFLYKQLTETTKDSHLKKITLQTLQIVLQELLKHSKEFNFNVKLQTEILQQLLKIDANIENIPLYPFILRIATTLIKISNFNSNSGGGGSVNRETISDTTTSINNNNNSNTISSTTATGHFDIHDFFDEICRKFFTFAQQLKTRFDSIEEDETNSFLAKYLNQTLPELNFFIKSLFERNPSPATLDDVLSSLEYWIKDRNSEVRICTGHVMNSSLDFYIKTMTIGCESPSRFNQTGSMLGKIVPRCIDSNATVRQTSIDILRKTLEISCIYETLTIADSNVEWINDLEKIRNDIVTDDPIEIYRLAGEIAKVISQRLSNLQYLQFCKSILHSINDPEQSSAIGASVVLKFFIQYKGSELFHCIGEYVKEALHAISIAIHSRAKSGVLKSLVALTKHHPKFVCNELLNCSLPLESNVIEFWQTLSNENEISGIILDNFLTTMGSSVLYETNDNKKNDLRQNTVSLQPFTIICALHEMVLSKEIQTELKQRFPEIFSMLLTTIAIYTNLAPPAPHPPPPPTSSSSSTIQQSGATSNAQTTASSKSNQITTSAKSTKFSFTPNKESTALNPCQITLETLKSVLDNLDMEQISAVLTVFPTLSTSTELNNFMDILTPMAVGLVNQFGITSSTMKQLITVLSRYVSSPYDAQRLTAIGLYSQLIPLKPSGEIASVIVLHLNASLSDPNALVRGFAIRGLAYIGNLTEYDIDKYTEMCLTALLKGIDDFNQKCLINIPLESMRGLSRILKALPGNKLETFQISLAIRIRPFIENPLIDIREAAILLFGDLCQIKKHQITTSNRINDGVVFPSIPSTMAIDGENNKSANNSTTDIDSISDALREQIFTNFIPLLLHLSENEPMIVRACKITLRKIGHLLNAPKVNGMVQTHLLEYGHLYYNIFLANFMKLIADELNDNISDFIESTIPFLKSAWPEVRGNAAIIIGYLHNLNKSNQINTENSAHKITVLLKDEQISVRIKAVNALGFMFGDIS